MQHRRLISSLSALLLLGCSSPITELGQVGRTTLSLRPAVQGGAYRAQAVVSPYSRADIQHLQIKVFTLNEGTETPALDGNGQPLVQDVLAASLDAPVTFGSLAKSTPYRIRGYAYSDAATASLISTLDAGSYVDVTLSDSVQATSLPVKLVDRTFSGQATSSISLTNGRLVGTGSFAQTTGYQVTTLGTGFSGPTGVAVDGAGNIYVADFKNNAVKKMDANGNNIRTLGSGFNQPVGVAVDAAGNVYVADAGSNAVKKMDASGNNIVLIGTGSGIGSFGFYPAGVAVDASGRVYVAADIYGLARLDESLDRFVQLNTDRAAGVAVDAAGNLYMVSSAAFAGVVTKMDASGNNPVDLGGDFNMPQGVAVDASGNIYVADTGNDAVKMMDASGNNVRTLGSGFNQPVGVAVDAAGNVYVADTENNAIKRIH